MLKKVYDEHEELVSLVLTNFLKRNILRIPFDIVFVHFEMM